MFDSLDEQMKKDEQRMVSKSERMMRWAIVAISALVIFGGLIAGVYYFT
jgi:hypothetical protein